MSRRSIILVAVCLAQLVGLVVLLLLERPEDVEAPRAERPSAGPPPLPPETPPDRPAEGVVDPGPSASEALPPGTLEGRVLLPDDVPPSRIEVVIRGEPAVAARTASEAESGREDPDFDSGTIELVAVPDPTGHFRFTGLTAGTASVAFRVAGEDELLQPVDDVTLGEDPPRTDPRLATVDLRATVRAIVLTVLDPQGLPVSDAVLAVEGLKLPPRCPSPETDLNGRCRLVTTHPTLAVVVLHPAFRPLRIDALAASGAVRLAPPIPVQLTLASGLAPIEAPFKLVARLDPVDPQATPQRGEFGPEGTAAFSLLAPGRYRVSLLLLGKVEGLPLAVQPAEIDIADSETPHIVQVAFSEAAVREQIARLLR